MSYIVRQSTLGAAPRHLPLALFALSALGFGLFALASGMDANWDLRNYHYYNAWALVSGRFGWDLLVSQVASFYNPVLDVPHYLLTQIMPARGVAFVFGALHAINVALLYALANRLLALPRTVAGQLAAAGIALAGALGAVALSEVGTVFYDNFLSFGVLGSLLIVVTRWDDLHGPSWRRSAVWALAAGLPAGLAFGLKQPAVAFAVGTCFAFLLAPGNLARRIWISFWFGIAVLIGLAVAGGPWMWRLWSEYGNPLFPYFNHIFKSDWGLIEQYRDTLYTERSQGRRLVFPFLFTFNSRLSAEIDFFDLRILAAYLLVPVGAGSLIWRWRKAQLASLPMRHGPVAYVFGAAAITFTLWTVMFSIYRYLVPLEMLAPLLVVAAIRCLPLNRMATAFAAGGVVAMIVVSTTPGVWIRVPFTDQAVQVEVPAIPNPEGTLVLMAGHEPMSYLLPSFPAEMRFLRIDSTFTKPDEDIGFNRHMREIVAGHNGPLGVLYLQREEHDVLRKLEQYQLALDRSGCQPVTSPLGPEDSPYAYCPVLRRSNP